MDARQRIERIEHDRTEGRPRRPTWFRGAGATRAPKQPEMLAPTAVAEHVLSGWAPEAPRIDRTTRITAFGSCFAAHISTWLGRRNYRTAAQDPDAQAAHVVSIGEGMVNSFVLRQQFEWAWEGRRFDRPLWHGYDGRDFGYDEGVRQATRRLFDRTDVFILTLGLSEVWFDAPTGEVFWRTIPRDVHDPKRHRFRVSTVEENRENIAAIHRLIRRHRPGATVILTLSPIPLAATFRQGSCITANSASKAVLRVAIDEVMRAEGGDGHLYYWPSYEMITDVFRSPYKPDRRHLPEEVLAFVMTQFEHVWCVDEGARPSLLRAWVRALAASGVLPERIGRFAQRGAVDRLKIWAGKPLHADPGVNAALQRLLADLAAEEAAARRR